jgi:hypothetical protein
MEKKRIKKPKLTWQGVNRMSKTMDGLIADGRLDEARLLIKSKEPLVDELGQYRLTMWSAKIEHHAGNRHGAIEILRKATAGERGYFLHLVYLAEYLIEEGMLPDAVLALDRLIAESGRYNEPYFLDDARLRKMYYLRELGRHDEIAKERAKLPGDVQTIVNGMWIHSSDFDL